MCHSSDHEIKYMKIFIGTASDLQTNSQISSRANTNTDENEGAIEYSAAANGEKHWKLFVKFLGTFLDVLFQ